MTRQRLLSMAIGGILVLAAGSTSAQAPAPPPPYGAPITLEQAKKIVAGAEAESKKNSWSMVITVLDSGGHVVLTERMDGAQLGNIDVARDKAYSAVAFRRPTKAFEDGLAQGGANLRLLKLSGASPVEGASRSWWTARSSVRSGSRAAPPSRTGRRRRPEWTR
jgi:glc operon protein GlcG